MPSPRLEKGGVSDKSDWVVNCNTHKCPFGCVYCASNGLKNIRGKKFSWDEGKVTIRRLDRHCGTNISESLWEIRPGDVVQVPSSHDITSCKMAMKLVKPIREILERDGIVVVHSKMSLSVAKIIGSELYKYRKKNLVIQITIGTTNAKLMSAVEPKAPGLQERLGSLQFLYKLGFRTGVACTPALDVDVKSTHRMVSPYTKMRFHIGSIRLVGNGALGDRAMHAFNRAYGCRDANVANVHPESCKARKILSDWLYSYGDLFDANWAERVIGFAKRRKKVVCERDVYDLTKAWHFFVAPRYTLFDFL